MQIDKVDRRNEALRVILDELICDGLRVCVYILYNVCPAIL